MTKFLSIVQKEFRIFFNSAIGYVFLVVFLGFSGWMFFRTFFLIDQASMRDFFVFLPWILLFLIPAFTMRAWAEESRSGTIETLLTSGVSLFKIVIAKATAMFLSLILALSLTFPFVISVAFLGDPDGGVIWISYLGTLFLGASYITIGLFVSSVTRNQIVAFLISIILCFFFYTVGENFITIFFPGFLADVFQQIGLGTHFHSMIRGVVDSRDVLFYITFILFFLAANTFVLSREYWPSKKFWKFALGIILVAGIVINVAGQFAFVRFDGTENKQYTLSKASKKILSEIEKSISIKAFISKNIPPQAQSLARDIKDILNEYVARTGGSIDLEILDPLSNDEAMTWARGFQIAPLQLQVIEKDQQKVITAYLGVAVTIENTDQEAFAERFEKKEVIPLLADLSGFEYNLTAAIKKVSTDILPVIGFLKKETPPSISLQVFQKNYDVQEVTLEEKEKISEIQTLVVAAPKESFTDEEAAILKGFVAEGKNLVFLFDTIEISNGQSTNLDVDFSNILEDYGIATNDYLIADRVNSNASFSTGFFRMSLPYPLWVRSQNISKSNAITNQLKSIVFPWSSGLTITPKENIKLEVLAKTSPYTKKFPTRVFVPNPPEEGQETEKDSSDEPEGTWKDIPVDLNPQQEFGISREKSDPIPLVALVEKEGEGKVLIASNSRFADQSTSSTFPENLLFLSNAIDALTIGEGLISVRSKQANKRPLGLVSDEMKLFVRWFNMLFMPFVVICYGLLRKYMRNQRKLTIQ